MTKTLFAAGCALLLSACGGGGQSTTPTGGTDTSTPPVATPAPTPTNPSTDNNATLLSAIGRDLTGFASSSTLGLNGNRLTSVGFVYSAGNPGIRATVAAPGSFRYQLVTGFYGNVAGTISLTRQSSSTDIYDELSGSSGQNSYRITQLVVGSRNPQIALRYATLAVARAYVANSDGGQTYNIVPLSFGLPFVPDGVSLPSVIAYEGRIAGIAHARQLEGIADPLSTPNVYDLSGTVHIELTPATGEVRGQIQLVGRNEATGASVDLGSYPIVPAGGTTASSTQFRASVAGETLMALLAGPNAEEVLGAFDAVVADPAVPTALLRVSAVLVGKR